MGIRGFIFAVVLLGALAAGAMAAETDAIPRTAIELPNGSVSAVEVSRPGHDSTRVGMALVCVVALILGLKWASGRFLGAGSKFRSSGSVVVLCRNTIGPKQNLVLVRIGRRLILVGDSGTQLTTLGEITDADEIAEVVGQVGRDKSEPLARTFGSLFKKAERGFDDEPADNENHITGDQQSDAGGQDDSQATRSELSGLTTRIRSLSRQFGQA